MCMCYLHHVHAIAVLRFKIPNSDVGQKCRQCSLFPRCIQILQTEKKYFCKTKNPITPKALKKQRKKKTHTYTAGQILTHFKATV